MPTLVASYAESNLTEDSWWGEPGDTQRVAQSFKPSTTVNISSVKWFGGRAYGTEGGTCVAKLYAHTGTYGSTGTPTGAALATSNTLALSSIGTSGFDYTGFSLFELTFSTSYQINAGTAYCVSIEYTTDNYLLIGSVGWSVEGTHEGNLSYWNGSAWAIANGAGDGTGVWDAPFYVYGNELVSGSVILESNRRMLLGLGI